MSDVRALLKHSLNYLFAQVATKALAFISIPVYTRILSVEEFGVVQVFLATVGIASVLLTLNTEVGISRYYYDRKSDDDFKEFVGTTIVIMSSVMVGISLVGILLLPWLSNELSFSYLLTLALLPVSIYNVSNSVFTQIYSVLLESKKIAIVSSVQTYLAFILSVVAILLLPKDKYYGQVIGTIAAMVVLWQYLVRQIKPYCIFHVKKEHVKYLLSYSLPYLPYTLSGIIIAQLGRIVISQYGGFGLAGQYSFATNIASIMLLFIGVVHSAWNPYYFQYMSDGDYKSIEKDYKLIWAVTLALGLVLILFGKELAFILGKEEYFSSIKFIPALIIGYIFYQWSYVYMRNTGFAKRVIWNALSVVTGGIVNITMCYLSINKYGEWGVVLSFILSYIVMLVTSWGINEWIIREYVPKFRSFFNPLIIWGMFVLAYYMVYELLTNNYVEEFFFKLLLCIIYCFCVIFPYRDRICSVLKRKK